MFHSSTRYHNRIQFPKSSTVVFPPFAEPRDPQNPAGGPESSQLRLLKKNSYGSLKPFRQAVEITTSVRPHVRKAASSSVAGNSRQNFTFFDGCTPGGRSTRALFISSVKQSQTESRKGKPNDGQASIGGLPRLDLSFSYFAAS